MHTRLITTGLLTSLTLLVAACTSNPVTSSNNIDASLVGGESEYSGTKTNLVINKQSVSDNDLSSPSKDPEHMMAARQPASDWQSHSNAYLTESVNNASLERPIAEHDYSQFTLPAVGQSDTDVVKNYGQPNKRQQGSNGVDMWDYGSFRVMFRNYTVSNASMWRIKPVNG